MDALNMIDHRSGAEAQHVPSIYATSSINGRATVAPRLRAYKCLRADAGGARPPGLRLNSSACSLRLRHDAASWRDHRTHSSIRWSPNTIRSCYNGLPERARDADGAPLQRGDLRIDYPPQHIAFLTN